MTGAATMELDELKSTWQRLDQQLQQQNQLNLELLRDKKLDKTRKSLRPLLWGSILQITLGIVSILFAVAVWRNNLDTTALLVSGLIIHVYGIMLIATAGMVIERLSKLDYSAPVVDIQKQILRIERAHITSGWLTGMPWWLLWIPYSLGIASLAGLNLSGQANASTWIAWNVVLGSMGMLATWLWYRWARSPKRPERAEKTNKAIAGTSLTRAKQFLEELQQFKQE